MMAASFVIKKIRHAYPHLKIGLLTLPRSRDLFKYNRDIDKLLIWQPVFLPFLCLMERLRHWDLLIDLNDDASRRSVLLLKLIKPERSIAFYNEKSQKNFEMTIKTYAKDKSYVVKRLSVMLKAFGIRFKESELKPVVYTDKRIMDELKRRYKNGKEILISVNISAGHVSRYWAVEKWIKLIRTLLRLTPKIKILVLSSPKDVKIRKHIIDETGNKRVIEFSNNDLHYFLSAIAISDLIISPDTSAVHAACSFGTPVIGLYPEPYWNFVSFRPIGVKNIVIRSKYGGTDSISFEEVKSKTIKFIRDNYDM
jgi:ADP-heptose:LPS heptosyltransferase